MTIFKSMTPDPTTVRGPRGESTTCEECGMLLFPGDWPFCKNRNPEDHLRD